MIRTTSNIKMKEWIKGYTAGFLDGEGWIGIINCNNNSILAKTGRKYYGVNIQIVQSDIEVLEWLKKQWGGGGIFPCSFNAKRANSVKWRWCLHTKDAINLLKEVYPYLKVKKKQAEIAIQFPLKEPRRKMDDETYRIRCKLAEKLKELKHKQKEFSWQLKKV